MHFVVNNMLQKYSALKKVAIPKKCDIASLYYYDMVVEEVFY